MSMKRWVPVVVGIAVVGAIEVYLWTANTDQEEPPPKFNPLEYFPHLQPGDIVPALEVEGSDGGKQAIDYSKDPKTLLFVLSATCGTCKKMIPVWNRLAREAPDGIPAFGLLVSGSSHYSYQTEQILLESGELEFPTFPCRDGEMLKQYKVSKVPQTLLVRSGGEVELCLMGLLSEAGVDEILARLEPVGEGTP
jgi:thiol-disulfide isomerase/thioredoxin